MNNANTVTLPRMRLLNAPIAVLALSLAALASCASPAAAPGPADKVVARLEWLDTGKPFGSNCVAANLAGKVLYFDPVDLEYREGKVWPKADYIFVTHSHDDHFAFDTILALLKEDTIVFVPGDVAYRFEDAGIPRVQTAVPPGSEMPGITAGDYPGAPGEGSIKVATVPMYTLEANSNHPRIMEWVGYRVEAEGVVILFSGDSGPTPELKALPGIDIAILSLTDGYTTSIQEAADLMKSMKAKYLVPIHWNGTYEVVASGLKGLLPAETKLAILPLK